MSPLVWVLGAALALAGPPGSGMPPAPAPAPPRFPAVEVHQLEQGGTVWVVPRPGLPLVRIEISLRGGMRGAPDPLALQAAGVLLDEGSRGWPAEAWTEAVADLGGQASVGVGAWRAWADLEVATGDEGAAVALLADALHHPSLRGQAVRRLRRRWVRQGEDAWRNTQTVIETALARALYAPVHPLGRLWGPADYRRLTPGRVRRAWRTAREDGGLAVLVVGDVEARRVVPLLEDALGWMTGAGPPAPLPPPRGRGPLRIVVDQPGVDVATVVLSLPAPGADDPMLPAAEAVVHALCGSFTSRLNQVLREEEGWTYGVDCRLDARPGFGRLTIQVPVAPARAGQVVLRMEEILEEAQRTLPTEGELEAARNSSFVEGARALTRSDQVSWRLGRHLTHGRSPAAEDDAAAVLAALDHEGARRAANGLLNHDDRIWLVVGEAGPVEEALQDSGRPPDRRWTAAGVTASRREDRTTRR